MKKNETDTKSERKIKMSLLGIILVVAILPAIAIAVDNSVATTAPTTVSIGNLKAPQGGTASGLLTVNSANKFFGANITISYDPSKVRISSINSTNSLITLTPNINIEPGKTRIIFDGPLTGLSGNVTLANITFTGKSSRLRITVNQIIDIQGNDIPTSSIDGNFSIVPIVPIIGTKYLQNLSI